MILKGVGVRAKELANVYDHINYRQELGCFKEKQSIIS